jgi:putative tricarboxylic transport membrane protein
VPDLQAGLAVIPVLLGVFAVAPILADQIVPDRRPAETAYSASLGDVTRALGRVFRHPVGLLRSAAIGTSIGILPGIGAAIGSTVSYAIARLSARDASRFGKGAEEGIVASETGNNATVCGALVPMISLGIPGSPADVILLAALMINAIQPGPMLIVERPDIFYGVIGSALLATLLVLPIMLLASVSLSTALRIPKGMLATLVIAFCMLGTYVSGKNIFDLWVLLVFSIIGLSMIIHHFPLPAFVIGFILGPMAETALRSGLMASRGSLLPLVERPIPLFLLTASGLLVVWIALRSWRAR